MAAYAHTTGPARYGLSPAAPAQNTPTSLHSIASPSAAAGSAKKLLSLDNPFTVFAGIAAFTFGLMAFSTSVRVGHTTAALSVGSPS